MMVVVQDVVKPKPNNTWKKPKWKTHISNTRNERSISWYKETTMTAHTKTLTEGKDTVPWWKY
jgi:hypothetical protein